MSTAQKEPAPTERKSYFQLCETCKFYFRKPEDIPLITEFISDFFAPRKNIAPGVQALALNAIEHGNLGIGYQRKAELLAEDIWEKEIRKRLELPENKKKLADLVLTRKDGGTYIIITDQGNGFEWQKYLTIDPGRAGQKHGRGIAVAKNLSFPQLSYNEAGNQAICFVPDEEQFQW